MTRGMKVMMRWLSGPVLVLTLGWAVVGPGVSADEPAGKPAPKTAPSPSAAEAKARADAKLMHTVYASTLEVMHHRFFRNDRSVLPARAMEDIFADLERQTRTTAKWISVNTRPMSIDHEPKTEFEKQAARALAAGKDEFERVEDGYLRRAGAIPLTSGCVSCHVGFMAKAPSSPRLAGLVISVPLARD